MPPDLEPTAPGAPAATPDDRPVSADEAVAWAAVVAAWSDEAAHRAYLVRFGDLEGLAAAGRRYREVLSRRPSDPVALRYRDEIVKRATVQGLALLPRTAPRPPLPRWVRWAIVSAGSAIAAAAIWRAFELMGSAGKATP